MADVKLKPGWIVKDQVGLFWAELQPQFKIHEKENVSQWEARCTWRTMNDCIVDPWPDKPDGGPECILEVK